MRGNDQLERFDDPFFGLARGPFRSFWCFSIAVAIEIG
jgi:hypothetical protein